MTVGRSGLILVLTGTPGTASVVAQAIDESTLHEQEGTLAGDNTLLVLFADEARLERWLAGSATIARPLDRRQLPSDGSHRASEAPPMKKVVLAYSGGLDTSVAVAWLKEQFDAEVVTLTVDLGGGSLREGVERRAMSAGASRAYVVDARERFVTDFVWPHLQANALYQGAYPLATALARPLIAQLLVEVARREGADAVAHGCTGKGNDQVRFDVATHALDPGLEVVAPMRVGMGLTRDQEIDFANERGIEIPITKASPYSIDVNLWGRSCETGVLEDPWVTPPADAYEWTVAPSDAPDAGRDHHRLRGRHARRARRGAARRRSSWSSGCTKLGGAHGVGRIDHVEDRLVGIKSREIYETPAATILHAAHRALEGLTLTGTRCGSTGSWPTSWPGSSTTACGSAPCRATCAATSRRPARRLGRGPDAARPRPGGRRRAPLAAVAVRQEPRDVRRGRRVRPCGAVGFIEIFGLPLRVEAARHGAVGARHGAAWSWTEPLLEALPTNVTDPEPAAV